MQRFNFTKELVHFTLTRSFHSSSLSSYRFITARNNATRTVRKIFLNNPQKRNILSLETIQELNNEFDEIAKSSDTRAVVVGGVGPVFSAGHDLRELASNSDAYRRKIFCEMNTLVLKMRSLPIPVVARVHALAAAGGCQLVAACDIAVALDTAFFSMPGITVGLFCSTPSAVVSRQIPMKLAMDMLITGQPISATEAAKAGLISRIVRGGDEYALDNVVNRLTKRICSYDRDAIALGKRTFYAQIDQPLSDAMDSAVCAMVENLGYDGVKKGMARFTAPKKKK